MAIIKMTEPEKIPFVRCNPNLVVERTSSCAMDELERKVAEECREREARQADGLARAMRYVVK
ncbi:MAG: hypothetical protein Q4A33_02625 [Candidatus Saccharibacteria bacterium]|nr:hypothetical protein [Candidatus Saccharibacteria bacterium]